MQIQLVNIHISLNKFSIIYHNQAVAIVYNLIPPNYCKQIYCLNKGQLMEYANK